MSYVENSSGSTSSSLLEGLRKLDPDAWCRASRLYAPFVYFWAKRAGLAAEDCEDIVQEVFRTLVMRLGDFRHERPDDTFRGWLVEITRNKLGDHIRQSRKQTRGIGGSTANELVQQIHDPISDSSGSDLLEPTKVLYHEAVQIIQTEFEERTWQAFWMMVVEGRRAAEVAAELSMTNNAVYLAKARVLRRLREVLGDRLP
jgi:RNA polymerase sigma-70 factor (ECF subfamily)